MAELSDPADVKAMDARIAKIEDWRGEMLSRLRALIREALPDVVDPTAFKALIRAAAADQAARLRK